MRGVVTWARTVGVATALIVGCLGSAGAVRLSGFPGPPAEADAVAAAVTAMGQHPVDTPGPVVVCEFFCPDYTGDGVVAYEAEPDHTDLVEVTYELFGTYADVVEPAAASRLTAAGWRALPGGDFTRGGLGYATLAMWVIGGVQFADFLLTVFPSLAIAVAGAGLAALGLIALPPRPEPGDLRLGPPLGHTGGHGAARS